MCQAFPSHIERSQLHYPMNVRLQGLRKHAQADHREENCVAVVRISLPIVIPGHNTILANALAVI